MRIIKESEFRKEIKTAPQCGYLFFGEEDYLKSFAVNAVRDIACPDPTFAFFNELKLEALDFTPQKLLDALMPPPMMSDYKLVLVSGLNFNTMKPSELEDLCEVLSQLPSYDYNILIITTASDCFDPGYLPKRPSNALKQLSAYLTAVNFERSTPAKLAAWVQKHFAHNGVEASLPFCSQMLDYCGHSMFALSNEIDKMCHYIRAHGQSVATEDIMRHVCIAATEYDAFAFTNAIMEGQKSRALDILADYRFKRIDPIIIFSEVIRVVHEMIVVRALSADGVPTSEIASGFKIHEYKVGLYQKSLRGISSERLKSMLNVCLETDVLLKRSQSGGYSALEKLICSI